MEANQRIKNHLLRKNQEVKHLINDATFGSYAILARSSLSKISFNLGQIELKMNQSL